MCLLFAFYGPAFSFAGQLRYVEAVLLGIAALNFTAVIRRVEIWEKTFIGLFFLAATSQIVVDQITNAGADGTIKRAGTYILLGVLVAILKWLGQNSWARIRWILLGYCISYVTLIFIGYSASANYADQPWRLGLGYSVTLGLCLITAWYPSILRVGAALLAALAVIHFFTGARALSAIVTVVALLALISSFRKRGGPPAVDGPRLFRHVLIGLILSFGIYKLAEYGTEQKWYPPELQAKMEEQFANPYGLIAAARPDTAAALYAIQKRPLMGHGSTNVDPDVWRFYVDVSTASFRLSNSYDDLYNLRLNQDWSLGTPSHSHLFGAWADAGVLAMLSWLALLGVSLYAGSRAALWNSALSPLITFVALSNVWDILFSPGPHRMDVAIRLMILLYALEIFRGIDNQQGRTVRRQSPNEPPRTAMSRTAASLRR